SVRTSATSSGIYPSSADSRFIYSKHFIVDRKRIFNQSMKTKFLSLLVILVVCLGIVGYLFAIRAPQSVAPLLPPPAPSSTEQFLVSVDPFTGVPIGSRSVFISSSTGAHISFQELTDELHRGRNPSYKVLIDQKEIGEADGNLMMPTFSPDGKLLSFRSM